ncbi:MAG: paraquat-inducible protein A [Campylobacterota bacterium]|nr:paraquat-inducible protein A [Campylobacterota bacterium]
MNKINCKYCDTHLRIRRVTPGFEYICPRCEGVVYRSGTSISSIIAMTFSTLIMFYWMINSPILTVTVFDSKTRSVLDSIIYLLDSGHFFSSIILFLTVVFIPIFMIILIYIIIVGKKLNVNNAKLKKYIHIYNFIKEWNMVEVYLVGVLISMIKLDELTILNIEYGLWFTFLYILLFYLTVVWFNPYDIIDEIEIKEKDKNSIRKSLLYLMLAFIFIIPSNILPIMPTYKFAVEYNNTIYDGIKAFYEEGDYFVSFVIFFTSICIPVLKIVGVFIMILMAKYGILQNYKKFMTKYHRVTDALGKYSMLDVFVVVIVAAFIQYNLLLRIESGSAIFPFTLVVFFTMMASKSFDTRLLWENK